MHPHVLEPFRMVGEEEEAKDGVRKAVNHASYIKHHLVVPPTEAVGRLLSP